MKTAIFVLIFFLFFGKKLLCAYTKFGKIAHVIIEQLNVTIKNVLLYIMYYFCTLKIRLL